MNSRRCDLFLLMSLAMMATSLGGPSETELTSGTKGAEIQALAIALEREPLNGRLAAIRKLKDSGADESSDVLLSHYASLPQAAARTNSRQTEKVAVVEALFERLDSEAFRTFGLKIIKQEARALRSAKKISRDRYYPQSLILRTVELVGRLEPTALTVNTLTTYSKDEDLHKRVRSKMLTVLLEWHFRENGLETPSEKVRAVLEILQVSPTAPFPWDIYRDREKRIAYMNTAEMKEAGKLASEWHSSQRGIENVAHVEMLSRLGMASVTELLDAIGEKDVGKERREYLVLVATIVCWEHVRSGAVLSEEDREHLLELRPLVEGIEDRGAFSRRATSAANLNKAFAQLGIDQQLRIRPPDPDGAKEESQPLAPVPLPKR